VTATAMIFPSAKEKDMQPLQGVTVVSLEQAIAAPYASRHLADLGARVIKVERPGVGTSPAPTTPECRA
jgi:crotonobetainyl-CoA:carnitine CoA-transferase CaiB-like acyl-CoA transferase